MALPLPAGCWESSIRPGSDAAGPVVYFNKGTIEELNKLITGCQAKHRLQQSTASQTRLP